MARREFYYLYTPMKASEGGTAQTAWAANARSLGMRVRFGRSALVGHYDVYVDTKNQRLRARLMRAMGYE